MKPKAKKPAKPKPPARKTCKEVRAAASKKAKLKKKGTPPDSGAGRFQFPVGNRWWECRAKHGRDGIWATPAELLEDCLSYFEWVDNNPLLEEKGFAFQGAVTKETFSKMRAATIGGLCIHLGIAINTWIDYGTKRDFSQVVEMVTEAIKQQKFAGAAADLLNANIIARDLGLRDAVSNEVTGAGGGPIEVIERVIKRPGASK